MFRFRKNQEKNKKTVNEPVIIEDIAYSATFINGTSMEFKTVKVAAVQFGATENQVQRLIDGGYKNFPKWAKDVDVESIVAI